jgi:predicted nucleotidyltransferase
VYFSGSGDWGMRFTNSPTDFRGFQIDDWEFEYFEIEKIEEN